MAAISKLDVVVLGATGYTGRLTAKYLGHHPSRSSFTLGFAGRSKQKLSALVKDIGLSDSEVELLVVDVTKPAEVAEVVKRTRVLVNIVGPYAIWGTPVVAACVRNGVHYVDLTGEVPWVKQIVDEFDYAATKTKAIIVPSCGVDSIPSDLAAYLGAKTLQTFCASSPPDANPGVDSSLSSVEFKGGGPSGGSLASVFNQNDMFPKRVLSRIQDAFWISPTEGESLPECSFYTMREPDTGEKHAGGVFVMKLSNRAIVQRTRGLLEMTSTSGPGRPQLSTLSYGPHFKYDEFMRHSNLFVATLVNMAIATFLSFLLITPVRNLLKRVVPQSGQGPAEEELPKGRLRVVNITTSAHSEPIRVKTTITGKGDPGYYLTAQMLGESALALALQYSDLPALAKEGGVLTPMTAIGDVLIERLVKSGTFEIESKVVGREAESRKDI